MSLELMGNTPEEPVMCDLCGERLGSSDDCELCRAVNRADKAESDLATLRTVLAHRLRILGSRPVYEDGKKENGISVEFLMAVTLLSGIKGILHPHEVEPLAVAEAERALLSHDNARYLYSVQPGCNCLHSDKPLPAIHDASCPFRQRYARFTGVPKSQPDADVAWVDGLAVNAAVWSRIKDGLPPDHTEEEFRTYSAVAFAKEQAQKRAAA